MEQTKKQRKESEIPSVDKGTNNFENHTSLMRSPKRNKKLW